MESQPLAVGGLRPDIDVDDNASTQRAEKKGKRAAADATEHVFERVPEHVLALEDESMMAKSSPCPKMSRFHGIRPLIWKLSL